MSALSAWSSPSPSGAAILVDFRVVQATQGHQPAGACAPASADNLAVGVQQPVGQSTLPHLVNARGFGIEPRPPCVEKSSEVSGTCLISSLIVLMPIVQEEWQREGRRRPTSRPTPFSMRAPLGTNGCSRAAKPAPQPLGGWSAEEGESESPHTQAVPRTDGERRAGIPL